MILDHGGRRSNRQLAAGLVLTLTVPAFLWGCLSEVETTPLALERAPQALTHPSPATIVSPSPRDQASPRGLIAGPGVGSFVPMTDPAFVRGSEATFVAGSDIVLGLSHAGQYRAYPVRQIAFHHIVNDVVDGVPYVITY